MLRFRYHGRPPKRAKEVKVAFFYYYPVFWRREESGDICMFCSFCLILVWTAARHRDLSVYRTVDLQNSMWYLLCAPHLTSFSTFSCSFFLVRERERFASPIIIILLFPYGSSFSGECLCLCLFLHQFVCCAYFFGNFTVCFITCYSTTSLSRTRTSSFSITSFSPFNSFQLFHPISGPRNTQRHCWIMWRKVSRVKMFLSTESGWLCGSKLFLNVSQIVLQDAWSSSCFLVYIIIAYRFILVVFCKKRSDGKSSRVSGEGVASKATLVVCLRAHPRSLLKWSVAWLDAVLRLLRDVGTNEEAK